MHSFHDRSISSLRAEILALAGKESSDPEYLADLLHAFDTHPDRFPGENPWSGEFTQALRALEARERGEHADSPLPSQDR